MDNLKDLPIVYIDETGIDRYLYRPYAGAPRGEKVYEKISGRRFEQTSIVAGQVDGEFIAPMIYKESMMSNFPYRFQEGRYQEYSVRSIYF
ncbi:degenerate transposase [Streptococcus pneumoniae]|nr:degenerate transposase [Streptococcus pneumoniae]